MEGNEDFLRAMTVAAGVEPEGQAEVAASQPVETQTQDSAEVAAEQTPAQEVNTPTPTPEAAAVEEKTPSATNEPYNFWPDLENRTGGFVKDEATLQAALERARNYETLEAEKASLIKPANEFIAKLDEMTKAGANKDQINAFVKLNQYGDLASLSPRDVMITKKVLTDGYSEAIAAKIVDREFNLNRFDQEDPDQRDEAEIMQARMAVEAKKDLATLEQYRKEISTVVNPEKEAAEQARLQEKADLVAYNEMVTKEAPAVAKLFPTKLDFEVKIGDETLNLEDHIDKDFLERSVSNHVAEYFRDSTDPINKDTVRDALGFAYGEYLKENVSKIIERVSQKVWNMAVEKRDNVYENRSGLPKASENQIVESNEAEDAHAAFLREMVGA